jgi:hypothetical protein
LLSMVITAAKLTQSDWNQSHFIGECKLFWKCVQFWLWEKLKTLKTRCSEFFFFFKWQMSTSKGPQLDSIAFQALYFGPHLDLQSSEMTRITSGAQITMESWDYLITDSAIMHDA